MSNASILLTLNAGSSSVKFALYASAAGLPLLAAGQIEGLLGAHPRFEASTAACGHSSYPLQTGAGAIDQAQAVYAILQWMQQNHPLRPVAAISHRVVHGGVDLVEPVRVDAALLDQLERLVPLAPLHQPHNLAGIRAAQTAFPGVPQVACFDTAFHRQHPFVADTFALPRAYYDAGIRRYGFHGLSYEYIARSLRQRNPALAAGRVIVAHLGNGASMCALQDGRSVASTMGFTALDGLPMGTRCGQLDPGVLLYLMTEKGMDAAAIGELLYKNSGLKGLSGLSHDVRVLLASELPAARDALAYFVSRCRHEMGGLAVGLGGLDAVVMTGGIGENAHPIRAALFGGLEWMGIELDPAANQAGASVISSARSRVQLLVLKTDEERMLAEHAAALLRL